VLAGPGTPGAGSGQLTIGGAGLLAALTPDSLKDIVERRTRLREAAADGAEKGKKYNGLLIVLGDGREACLEAIDSVLGEFTDQYKLAEVSPTMDGNSSLEYLLSLPKDTPAPRLIATLRERAGQYIVAAEYRNFKARKTGELLR
jgi:hypothetical protein